MKIQPLYGGGIRVFLSREELQKRGLTYATMERGQPQTEHLIEQLTRLFTHGKPAPFPLCMEAVSAKGGCLLFLTPFPKSATTQGLIYAVDGEDIPLQIAGRWQGGFAKGNLYRMNDRYWLEVVSSEELSPHQRCLLSEYGEWFATGKTAVAHLREYGEHLIAVPFGKPPLTSAEPVLPNQQDGHP